MHVYTMEYLCEPIVSLSSLLTFKHETSTNAYYVLTASASLTKTWQHSSILSRMDPMYLTGRSKPTKLSDVCSGKLIGIPRNSKIIGFENQNHPASVNASLAYAGRSLNLRIWFWKITGNWYG